LPHCVTLFFEERVRVSWSASGEYVYSTLSPPFAILFRFPASRFISPVISRLTAWGRSPHFHHRFPRGSTRRFHHTRWNPHAPSSPAAILLECGEPYKTVIPFCMVPFFTTLPFNSIPPVYYGLTYFTTIRCAKADMLFFFGRIIACTHQQQQR
jgi:hypothetical protein